jgi:hypothetical protein
MRLQHQNQVPLPQVTLWLGDSEPIERYSDFYWIMDFRWFYHGTRLSILWDTTSILGSHEHQMFIYLSLKVLVHLFFWPLAVSSLVPGLGPFQEEWRRMGHGSAVEICNPWTSPACRWFDPWLSHSLQRDARIYSEVVFKNRINNNKKAWKAVKICEHSIFTLGLLVSFTWFNMVWNQSIEHSPTSKRWFSTWFQIREAVTFQENGKRPGDQWWPGPTKIDAHQKMLVVLEDLCHRKAFDFDWRRKPLGFGDLSSFNANGQTARPNHLEFKSKLQCYRAYPIYFPFLGKNLPGSPLSVTDPHRGSMTQWGQETAWALAAVCS